MDWTRWRRGCVWRGVARQMECNVLIVKEEKARRHGWEAVLDRMVFILLHW